MSEEINNITSICFLNVIWFNHLKQILKDHEILTPTLDGFILNAVTENRKLFDKYKEK